MGEATQDPKEMKINPLVTAGKNAIMLFHELYKDIIFEELPCEEQLFVMKVRTIICFTICWYLTLEIHMFKIIFICDESKSMGSLIFYFY